MREFRIVMSNHAGELARIAQGLSRKGVNIRSVCATAEGNQVTMHLIGHDVEATRRGLEAVGAQFTEQEVVQLIIDDRVGELGRVAEQLAEANINIDAIYLTGRVEDMVELAVAVDDVKKAKRLLQ